MMYLFLGLSTFIHIAAVIIGKSMDFGMRFHKKYRFYQTLKNAVKKLLLTTIALTALMIVVISVYYVFSATIDSEGSNKFLMQ